MIALNEKFRTRLEERGTPLENLNAPARIVMKVFEEGSWVEDDDIQNMWAGLLASSCTKDGKDDSNLIFINILSQMTAPEIRLFDHISRSLITSVAKSGSTMTRRDFQYDMNVEPNALLAAARLPDASLLPRVLERLRLLGLVDHKLVERAKPPGNRYDVKVLDAGLHLYARCQGYSGSPDGFLKIQGRYPA